MQQSLTAGVLDVADELIGLILMQKVGNQGRGVVVSNQLGAVLVHLPQLVLVFASLYDFFDFLRSVLPVGESMPVDLNFDSLLSQRSHPGNPVIRNECRLISPVVINFIAIVLRLLQEGLDLLAF